MSIATDLRADDRKGLTVKNLRAFFWLARHRNFRRAAMQLKVTQPAVTTRISMLEEELGVRLFDRSQRAVELTPEGHEALRLCEAVLDSVDRMSARFSGSTEPFGIVRIGVVDTVARTWLPILLSRMQDRYPGIDLEIVTESTTTLHAMLRGGSLSMSISISSCDDTDIENSVIGQYDMEWIASPAVFDREHVHTLQDLIALPQIGYLPMSPPALWIDRYFGDGFKERVVHNTTNSMSTMIWLAENGLGIAAIPPRAVPQQLAEGRLAVVRTHRAFDPMPFYLNYRFRPYSPVVETVKSLIVDVSATHP